MPKGVYTTKKNVGFGQEWPDLAINIMRRVLEDGGSFSTVVRELKNHGLHTFTRNACIGKAKRMGIESRNGTQNTKAAGMARQAIGRASRERRMLALKAEPVNELLREEGTRTVDREPGGAGGYKVNRRMSKTTEELAALRKPKAITPIVERNPTTSKPFCDLRRGECRWPTTIECTEACGAPATIGSYCDKHAVVAYRAMPTPKRNAVITKTQDIDRKRDRDAEITLQHFLDEPRMVGISGPFMGPGSEFESAAIGVILEQIIDDEA